MEVTLYITKDNVAHGLHSLCLVVRCTHIWSRRSRIFALCSFQSEQLNIWCQICCNQLCVRGDVFKEPTATGETFFLPNRLKQEMKCGPVCENVKAQNQLREDIIQRQTGRRQRGYDLDLRPGEQGAHILTRSPHSETIPTPALHLCPLNSPLSQVPDHPESQQHRALLCVPPPRPLH